MTNPTDHCDDANQDNVSLQNLSIFKGSLLNNDEVCPLPPLPPSSFVNTLRTRLARESKNYSLLVWLLNSSAVILTQRFEHQRDPFLVFRQGESRLYLSFMDVRQISVGHENISLDATLVPEEYSTFTECSYECSIVPHLLQKTDYDHFQLDRLSDEYRRQFVKTFNKFEVQKLQHPKYAHVYLQRNLSLLTAAFVRDLFYDITFKYCSWSKAKRSTRLDFLKSLRRYHKEYTFVLSYDSIEKFTERLDHLTCLKYASEDEVNAKLTYGIWINAEEGIILLCNGIAHSWDIVQIPSYSYQKNDNIEQFVKKYMLFCNMSVLETCLWFF